MVCTTLTVTAPIPIFEIVPATTGFASGTAYLNGDCTVPIADVSNVEMAIGVQIKISNAPANFDLDFSWKLDGVAKTASALSVNQSIGTTQWYFKWTAKYVSGTYTVPVVTLRTLRRG